MLEWTYPLCTRAYTPQTMIFSCFAALSSIGVRPVRLNRLPCRTRKSPWLRSQSRKEINFVPCKALEWSVPSGTLIESNATGRKIYSLSTVYALVKRGYEHQSTYNPNLPLRYLMYIADLYSSITRDTSPYAEISYLLQWSGWAAGAKNFEALRPLHRTGGLPSVGAYRSDAQYQRRA